MIALIQRVTSAHVDVAGEVVGRIGAGLLVFVAVERGDTEVCTTRLWERTVGYRIFPDQQGKMNLSVADVAGEVLLVSQFTLAADTSKGMRPSFSKAASPGEGKRLFDCFVELAQQSLPGRVATGHFGADMRVHLVNDGPVTFWLRVPSGASQEF